MATQRAEGPGFFERIAGTVPAAAFSNRCGAYAGPRLDKPGARPDLATPEGLVAALGPRWAGIEAEPAARRLALALLASQALHGRRETLTRLDRIVPRLAAAREADVERDATRLFESVVGGGRAEARPASELTAACGACYADLAREAPELPGKVDALAAPHAYGSTAYLAVLHAAKHADGVLPDAYFLWLRPVDPLGWALTTDHGRLARFAVAVAAHVHHAAEAAARRPLAEPDMSEVAPLVAKWTA